VAIEAGCDGDATVEAPDPDYRMDGEKVKHLNPNPNPTPTPTPYPYPYPYP